MGPSASRAKGIPDDMTPIEFVNSLVEQHTIVAFSKTSCPYCYSLKGLLSKNYSDVDTKIVEINTIEEGHEIQKALEQKTGQWTVPNVFVKQQHVGGCDDTTEAHQSGKLKQLLQS